MTISPAIRRLVRERAQRCCEFCGVSETDTGGLLTIDHYQPISKAGTDHFDNLLYCCAQCNLHKQNYWPKKTTDLFLWNPRFEPANRHFLLLDNGRLHPLTPVGDFTIKRLRLNRSQLIDYRLHKRQEAEAVRLLEQYQKLMILINQINMQALRLVDEQTELLLLQQELIRLLTENK